MSVKAPTAPVNTKEYVDQGKANFLRYRRDLVVTESEIAEFFRLQEMIREKISQVAPFIGMYGSIPSVVTRVEPSYPPICPGEKHKYVETPCSTGWKRIPVGLLGKTMDELETKYENERDECIYRKAK